MRTQDDEQLAMSKKRQVCFSQDVLLYVDCKYSLKQRRAMFYTPNDYKTFGNEVHVQIKVARAIGDLVLENSNQAWSLRGLEQHADETASHERRRRKHIGQLTVFVEQDRQLMEDGNVIPVDFDSMARRYGSVTKKSQELARKWAVRSQEMEKQESIAPLPTPPRSPKTTTVPRSPVNMAPKLRFSVVSSAA